MKYFVAPSLLLVMALLVPASFVSAEVIVRTGESVSIGADQTVSGNFYGVGGTVAISGTVDGDAFVAGGTITLNGSVAEDTLIIGGTVGIHGEVGDDVRIIAGDVTIADAVAGNVVVVGARTKILSSAEIAGDVLVFGGTVVIEGSVGGDVLGNAESIRIDGPVAGGVDVTTRQLTLGERAAIEGDLQYVSIREFERAAGATVVGSVVRNDAPRAQAAPRDFRTMLIPLFVSLFATLSLYLLFRRPLERFAVTTVHSIGLSTLVGFATVILAPLVISILLVSILGLFVGLMALFLFLLGFVVTLSLMSAVCGGLLSYYVTKKAQVNVLWITIGAVTIQAMLIIPIVGPVAVLLLLFATLGGAVHQLFTALR